MAKPLLTWSYGALHRLNSVLVVGSVVLCALLQPHRLPGMTLLDVAPNWLLIWVVTWSVRRPPIQGAIAGIALGWIQDAMTAPHPTHAIGLGVVGFLTSSLDKQRFIEEDFISAALLVFLMAILAEGILATQIALRGEWVLPQIWIHLQQVALSSALISSLWTPLVYVPLNRWWDRLNFLTDR
ncbi:MAG: rod shape-determining protein MreD [Thermosynechococcaceae cyanobacterium]